MKKNYDYTEEVRLKHNEKPAKVNIDTGAVDILEPSNKKPNNIPEGKQQFEPKGMFVKSYTKSWEYLDKQLTPLEFKIVAKMCRMAKMNTNSLEPLSDETTAITLSEEFNISRNTAKPLFNKLLRLGVYGIFKVIKDDCPYTKYWILNPYLSFSGRLIHSDIALLFVDTKIEKAYNNRLS